MMIFSCSRKNGIVEDQPMITEKKEQAKEFKVASVETMMEMPDCLTEYKDVGRINTTDGELITIMNKMMIKYGNSGRYNPCNLPSDFEEGDNVVFGGFVKESPPNVRLPGTPMRLTFIKKK